MQQFGQTREGRRCVRCSRGAAAAALGQNEVVQLMRVRMLLRRRCLRVCCGTFLARAQAGGVTTRGGGGGGTRSLRGRDSVVKM